MAEELGVSASTVSRAISGKGRIGEATRKKVMDYIKIHDYHPNGIAKSLAQSRTNNIAIIIPEVKELVDLPFFYTCMYGVNEVALANGYDMFVITTSGKDNSHLKRLIDNNKVDGMILGRTYRNDVFASYLKERGMPFVTIGSIDDDEIVQVYHDNEGACRDLTSILLSRKLNPIAYLGNSAGQVVNDERFAGYVRAHRDAGIELDWDIIFLESGTTTVQQRQVDEILKKMWGVFYAKMILCAILFYRNCAIRIFGFRKICEWLLVITVKYWITIRYQLHRLNLILWKSDALLAGY